MLYHICTKKNKIGNKKISHKISKNFDANFLLLFSVFFGHLEKIEDARNYFDFYYFRDPSVHYKSHNVEKLGASQNKYEQKKLTLKY